MPFLRDNFVILFREFGLEVSDEVRVMFLDRRKQTIRYGSDDVLWTIRVQFVLRLSDSLRQNERCRWWSWPFFTGRRHCTSCQDNNIASDCTLSSIYTAASLTISIFHGHSLYSSCQFTLARCNTMAPCPYNSLECIFQVVSSFYSRFSTFHLHPSSEPQRLL